MVIGANLKTKIPIPIDVDSTAIAVYAQETGINKHPNWYKAGDLVQTFKGNFDSENFVVPLKKRVVFDSLQDLGLFRLSFLPVRWHEGLDMQLWRWTNCVFGLTWDTSEDWNVAEKWEF